MAPHSSTVAQKIPWIEEPGGLQSMGLLRVDTTERLHFHFIGHVYVYIYVCTCLLLHAISCFRPWEYNTLEPLLHL